MRHQRVLQPLIVAEVEHHHLLLIVVGVEHRHLPLIAAEVEQRHPHDSQVEQALRVKRQDKRPRIVVVILAFLLSHPDLVRMEHRVTVAAVGPEGAVVIVAAEDTAGVPGEVDIAVEVAPEAAVAEDDKQKRFSNDLKASYRSDS